MKIAKFIKLIGLIVYKKKERDKAKKNQDSSKFWTKNQDCPSKSGTVGECESVIAVYVSLTITGIQMPASHTLQSF